MSPAAAVNTQPWPQPLIDLLERQQGLVDKLVRLAESQSSLIAASSTDQLLSLLAERQAVIDEFTASQGELAELTHGLDERLEDVDPGQRDAIKSLIGVIGERLGQVMRRDEADQASLRSNRNQVKQEIASMGAARTARNAYSAGGGVSNRFADRRG